MKLLLQQGLKSLDGPQKRMVELASYDGLSMKEIADKTGTLCRMFGITTIVDFRNYAPS